MGGAILVQGRCRGRAGALSPVLPSLVFPPLPLLLAHVLLLLPLPGLALPPAAGVGWGGVGE